MKTFAIAVRLLLITFLAYSCTEETIESDRSILEASLISHEHPGDPAGKFSLQFMRKNTASDDQNYTGIDFTLHSPGIAEDSMLIPGKYRWSNDFVSTAPFTISSIFNFDATSLARDTAYYKVIENVSDAEITVERQENFFVIQYKIIRQGEIMEAAYVGPLKRIRYVN